MFGVDFEGLQSNVRAYAKALTDAAAGAPSVLESVSCPKCGGVRMGNYHHARYSFGVRIPAYMTMRCITCSYSTVATALDERSEQTQP